jgi:hypothetical protein
MKAAKSSGISPYYVICAFAGAFVGLVLPAANTATTDHSGILAAIIAFELNYLNLLTTLGAIWLLYWLVSRKVVGREGMVLYGGLGFVCVRLILAAVNFFHRR